MTDNYRRLAEMRLERLARDLEHSGYEVRVIDVHEWDMACEILANRMKRETSYARHND